MRKIKMIGLDLDGTLLNSKKELSSYTADVLEQVMEAGVHIVISTGRPITGIPKELLAFSKMRYIITSNGGRIIDLVEDKVIYENPVPYDTALEVLEIVSEYDTLKEVYFNGQGYVNRSELEAMEHFVKNQPVREYILNTRLPVDNIWDKMESMKPKGLDKVHAIFADEEEVEKARARLQALGKVVISGSIGSNLEMNAPGVHKGEGLLKLGELLGVSCEEIMACGDGGNDLEMIKTVGFGVAMSNATAEVRAAADYITCSNDEDGVAKVIEKYVLNA